MGSREARREVTEEMLMGDVCLTLENCGRHDLSNALSDEISRLRAALTARDKAIATAEEALKALTYDCVFPDNFAEQRAKDIRSAVAALAALAAVKEKG